MASRAGDELAWIPRVINGLFWIAGGFFFLWIALRIASPPAATLTTAYYLFLPTGVLVSRSFQPDALMMLLFLATLAAIIRHHNRPDCGRLLMAGVLAGATLLIRPLPFFTICLAFAALTLLLGLRAGRFLHWQFFVFLDLALLPVGAY